MIKLLELEFFKIRRKKIWLMVTLFLFVEMLWLFISTTRYIAKNADYAAWEAILFNLSSMNGLFMPIIIAVVVSRICDMEHKGATWKMLVATNVDRSKLYLAKYICANMVLLYGILTQVVLGYLIGVFHGFSGAKFDLFLQFFSGTLLTTLAITALQQWISLVVKNQAFALCLGMVGGFIGLTSALFPAAIRHLFIWSYYLDLTPVTLQYSHETGGTFIVQHLSAGIVLAALVMTIVFYIAGRAHVTRQEI